MTPSCRPDAPDTIPQTCSDAFRGIEHRLTRIEGKVDDLADGRKLGMARLWSIAKGAILLVVGWVLAQLK